MIFSFIDSYVADEIITSAAGVRIRVGNTDAEGRMVMADVLHHTSKQVRVFPVDEPRHQRRHQLFIG